MKSQHQLPKLTNSNTAIITDPFRECRQAGKDKGVNELSSTRPPLHPLKLYSLTFVAHVRTVACPPAQSVCRLGRSVWSDHLPVP
jgi:hypothetical protein